MSTFSLWIQEKKMWIIVWGIAILLITLSFASGYLIARQENPAPIVIEKCSKN